MKTGNRKKTAVLASALLASALLAQACSNGKDGATAPANDAKSEAGVTAAGTYPIAKDKITLKVVTVDTGRVENIETNEFVKWYEDKTNIHIDWTIVPQKQAQEKLNLMLATGDVPDILMKMPVSNTQLMMYGSQGLFLSLNDLIAKDGVETKKMFADNPQIKQAVTAPNGNIYSLPNYSDCYHCSMPEKMWLYQPWMDKLGLKEPTTTEELYQVLKAFKDKDPNGNGKADEIPLVGAINGPSTNIDGFIMNSFIYYDKTLNHGLIVKNGVLDAAYTQPGYKEALKYYNRLYKDGLLSPLTFTQDINQLKKLVENPDIPIVGAVPALAPSAVAQIGGKSTRWLELSAIAPLKGPEGVQQTPFSPYGTFSTSGFIVTSASKHPEAAFRWGEGFYNQDVMMLARFGKKDVGWRDAKPDEIGIDGRPAKWTRLEAYGNVQNSHLGQINFDYQSGANRLSESAANPSQNQEVILYNATKTKYEPYKEKQENLIPPLWFDEQQASKINELETTIDDYVDQMFARFVMGDVSIDEGWADYLKTLDGMNLKTYLKTYQDAYDAKKSKS